MEMFSLTPFLVPENLKKSVGNSFHTRGAVAPPILTTFIWTSSIISMAATGMPVCITSAAAAAASLMEGKVTTATEKSWGMTASFSVATNCQHHAFSIRVGALERSTHLR
jgi:hypothetical protein